MPTYHIHIQGQVQGVGFRPFILRLAIQHGVNGWVNNSTDGVHVRLTADKETALEFYDDSLKKHPKIARVLYHSIREVGTETFTDFTIKPSVEEGSIDLLIPPDQAICEKCREELSELGNRRHNYAFTTCTDCGPRYSIMERLPYDREHTTMRDFVMCVDCQAEYTDPGNIRLHSQTNSCPTCGMTLTLLDRNEVSIDIEDKISMVAEKLLQGKVVAVKGIGGFLLLGDATNDQTVSTIRKRKNRPEKPLAVIYPTLGHVDLDFHLSEEERKELGNEVGAISLLACRENPSQRLSPLVAPRLNTIGVMLPYAPVLQLITQTANRPLVATSANMSGSPIIYRSNFNQLLQLADFVLDNNRDIQFPQDDSVIKNTVLTGQKIIIRRSRGLAPNYYQARKEISQGILALGAEMKGSFAISGQRTVYLSQYLGDLGSYDNQEQYQEVLSRFMHLMHFAPKVLVHDLHPTYFTTTLAQQWLTNGTFQCEAVQHHEAHFCAILGERDLFDVDQVLGVIWDGTGLGFDGNIWGGEFLLYEQGDIHRHDHWSYFPVIAGDQMSRQPRLSAISILGEEEFLKSAFDANEWSFFTKARQSESIGCSSVGRLFDAVAAVLGLIQKTTYEGQAAMLVEQLAVDYMKQTNWQRLKPYAFTEAGHPSARQLLIEILIDRQRESEIGLIAARFHRTLVESIRFVASKLSVRHIAFSGGVFQNGLLVDLIKEQLIGEYNLHFHQQLPAGDENIAFGQLMYHQHLNKEKIKTEKIGYHVFSDSGKDKIH